MNLISGGNFCTYGALRKVITQKSTLVSHRNVLKKNGSLRRINYSHSRFGEKKCTALIAQRGNMSPLPHKRSSPLRLSESQTDICRATQHLDHALITRWERLSCSIWSTRRGTVFFLRCIKRWQGRGRVPGKWAVYQWALSGCTW